MASECTCETYGWCEPCRVEPVSGEPVSHDLYVFGHEEADSNRCVWCRQWFDHDDTYVLGDYTNAQRVCGAACPKRPNKTKRALRRERDRPTPLDREYVVTIVVNVPVSAHNSYSARRRATRQVREHSGDSRDMTLISSAVKRKRGLTNTNT